MKKRVMIFLLASCLILANHATALAVLVTEKAPTEPHEIVGELEVEVGPSDIIHPAEDVVGVLTLGALHWHHEDIIKKKIIEKLKDKAKLYSADAVMNVRYYPDPAKPSQFRGGVYRGKGDLIKYKRRY
ncbi:MAG: hypothetical protein PHE61_07745 [Candidatus Omnitrophica bacterium]|nr:hypothetical protein [Candidatus Omnitrophota bacterium]